MRGKIAIPIVLVICAMGAGAFALARGSKTKDAGDKAVAASVPIVAGTVAQHEVPIYLTGVGTVIAYNTDVVRAQIQGQIISINFTEGQQVRAGDLLAQIDPRPYQAQIEQFTANRDRDQAQLANALANLNRYTPLEQKGFCHHAIAGDPESAGGPATQSAVKADQALVDAANVQLSYTRLTSPIDGVTGIRQIDVGNIISPANTNGVVIVTQLEPISLIFTLPETVLPQIQTQQQKSKQPLWLSPIIKTAPSSWMRAPSASSTIKLCRRPARSSSRRIFPTQRIGCGPVNS